MKSFFVDNAALIAALAGAVGLVGVVWAGLRRGWHLVSWASRLLFASGREAAKIVPD